ncbi:nitroreductase family protein [Candidatus Enterococcus ikei]|uniref:Nitroreductase family protein n=1 Tax=Candidatus Enterococcus ikei TaxID=2815326 RepID=A0ABS3H319_9ENTE|nr:nitroreductase family protein [Enterococcus sp. DIV0869a]MBO0441911.1 nitroreductase family protein [Enterococcus sp. DIV0869a]
MNQTIELLKNRRSYREFDENYALPKVELQAILDAARQAPSWMNGQFYSIIVIQDKKIREQLVKWNPGNPHMLNSSVFLLFIGDLHRTKIVSAAHESSYSIDESVEPMILAVTDASLALENAVIAVESLGLGSVVVGSIRKYGKEICQLLDLPDNTFPLFGLSIGKPVVEMKVKPRLPETSVVHYDKYRPYAYSLIEQYNDTMEQFGEARETKRWSQKFSDYFAEEPSMITDQLLQIQGLLK